MKATSLVVFLVSISLVGCTSWDYKTDGDEVSFNISSWNHDPLKRSVTGADAATFRALRDGYAVDKNRAYYKGEVILGSEPTTFQVIGNKYARDQSHVYLYTCTIKSADPRTFELLSNGWARDKDHVFHQWSRVPEADRSSFRHLKGYWALDNEHAFHAPSWVTSDCTGSSLKVFNGVDPGTFEVVNSFTARDKSQVYRAR